MSQLLNKPMFQRVVRVVSAKQRAANRANSLKSTGPKSEEGKFRAKLNSAKHGLSLPIDERVFADQIKSIVKLIRADCSTDTQALELAKRIIDFERNEAFLQDFKEDELQDEIIAWGFDPRRLKLARLANSLRAKQPVSITFTLPQKDRPVTLKGKAHRGTQVHRRLLKNPSPIDARKSQKGQGFTALGAQVSKACDQSAGEGCPNGCQG